MPGDSLQIEMLAIEPGEWGYTVIEPGMGLLPEDFPGPSFKVWDLSTRQVARLNELIAIPIEPFLGAVGVAHGDSKRRSSIPPWSSGGNLDIKHLTAGSVLWLPVAVEGALLSVGDAHAAQGDGEICGSAIETTSVSRIRVTVKKGKTLTAP
jgi:acetamidase/formamidase